jgi:hypothetical protein
LKIQAEQKVEKVKEKLTEAWTTFRKTMPQLPESSATDEPTEQIELVQVAWTELLARAKNIEVQLWETKLEVELQPHKLKEQLEKVVLEGNNAIITLHKKTMECTTIFKEISDWMGVISWCNQTLEDLCSKIQSLNEEAAKSLDPLEQQAKFDEIQQVDNDLNALFEAQTVAKKEL